MMVKASMYEDEPMMSEREQLAVAKVGEWHAGQVRRFSNEPYVNHLFRSHEWLVGLGVRDEDVLVGVLVHDAVEDQPGRVSFEDIGRLFGPRVRTLSEAMTVPQEWGVEVREKRVSHEEHHARVIARLEACEPSVWLNKCADRADNVLDFEPSALPWGYFDAARGIHDAALAHIEEVERLDVVVSEFDRVLKFVRRRKLAARGA